MPGVMFPPGSLPWKHYGAVPLHPVQLYEAAGLLFIFIMFIFLKNCFCYRFSVYAVTYGTLRFALEYLRGDDRGNLLSSIPLSPAQIISLVLIISGVVIMSYAVRNKPNLNLQGIAL